VGAVYIVTPEKTNKPFIYGLHHYFLDIISTYKIHSKYDKIVKLAKKEKIKLRRSFIKEIKTDIPNPQYSLSVQ